MSGRLASVIWVLTALLLCGRYPTSDASCMHEIADSYDSGDLLPVNPNISLAAETPYVMTCMLSEEYARKKHVNSSAIRFRVNNSRKRTCRDMGSEHVNIVNSTTAQLALDDLSETDTNVYCCVVIDDVMYEVGAQHMVIGMPPHEPRVLNATVGNWANMTIYWSIEKRNRLPSQYTAWWKKSNETTWRKCPMIKRTSQRKLVQSCVVAKADVSLSLMLEDEADKIWQFQVIGTNDVGTASSAVRSLRLGDMVQPGPLQFINTESISSNEALLSWKFPYYLYEFEYNLTYTCRWQTLCPVSKQISGGRNQEVRHYRLSDLHPNTMYTVFISSRVSFGSLWSRSQTITFTTGEDIPGETPVERTNFWSDARDNTYRDVTIGWREMPEIEQHGEIISYSVRLQDSWELRIINDNITGDVYTYEVKGLEIDKGYSFFVSARTRRGKQEQVLKAIQVPPETQDFAIHRCSDFVARAINYTVVLTWACDDSVQLVRLYWCRGNRLQDTKCFDQLLWQSHAARDEHGVIWLDSDRAFTGHMFGVAVELKDNQGFSGIQWLQCVYDESKPPARPTTDTDLVVSNVDEVEFKLSSDCGYSPSRTTAYRVTYCACASTSQCDGISLDNICTDKPQNLTLDVNTENIYALSNLKSGTQYALSVRSLSSRYHSSPITFCVETLPESTLVVVAKHPAFIIVCVLLIVIFLVLLMVLAYRSSMLSKCKAWFCITIKTPKMQHQLPASELRPVSEVLPQRRRYSSTGDLHKHRPGMMTDSRGLKPEKTWNDVSIGTDTSGTPAVPLNIISRPHGGSSSARSDTDDNNEQETVFSSSPQEVLTVPRFLPRADHVMVPLNVMAPPSSSSGNSSYPLDPGSSYRELSDDPLSSNSGGMLSDALLSSSSVARSSGVNSSIDPYPKVAPDGSIDPYLKVTSGDSIDPYPKVTPDDSIDPYPKVTPDEGVDPYPNDVSDDPYARTEATTSFAVTPQQLPSTAHQGAMMDPHPKVTPDDPYTRTEATTSFAVTPQQLPSTTHQAAMVADAIAVNDVTTRDTDQRFIDEASVGASAATSYDMLDVCDTVGGESCDVRDALLANHEQSDSHRPFIRTPVGAPAMNSGGSIDESRMALLPNTDENDGFGPAANDSDGYRPAADACFRFDVAPGHNDDVDHDVDNNDVA